MLLGLVASTRCEACAPFNRRRGWGASSFVTKTRPQLQANRLMIKRGGVGLELSRCGQRVSFFAQRDERVHASCSTCRNVAGEKCDAGKNG